MRPSLASRRASVCVLAAQLKIDMARPPSVLPIDIFCHPFMSRAVWNVVAPIVRTHPGIQRAFAGHPNLQVLARMDYDELRQLPLRAYITGGLYLSYPYNFMSRAIGPQHETTEYLCDFMDGDHLVKVIVDLESQAVTIAQ